MLPRKLLALEQEDLVPKTSEPSGCSGSSRAAPDDDHVVRIIFYYNLISNTGSPRAQGAQIVYSENVIEKSVCCLTQRIVPFESKNKSSLSLRIWDLNLSVYQRARPQRRALASFRPS